MGFKKGNTWGRLNKGHPSYVPHIMPEEVKRKIGDANRGKKASVETRLKQSVAAIKRGNNKPLTGKMVACMECKKETYKYPRDWKRVRNNFCSKKCAYKFRDEGMTSLQERVRDSVNYSKWRMAVLKRDNFTCVECGKKERSLHADHIEAFAVLLRKHGITDVQTALLCTDLWELANGRTLCAKCHWQTPNYGYKAWQEVKSLEKVELKSTLKL